VLGGERQLWSGCEQGGWGKGNRAYESGEHVRKLRSSLKLEEGKEKPDVYGLSRDLVLVRLSD
jgi:hypothetical protein